MFLILLYLSIVTILSKNILFWYIFNNFSYICNNVSNFVCTILVMIFYCFYFIYVLFVGLSLKSSKLTHLLANQGTSWNIWVAPMKISHPTTKHLLMLPWLLAKAKVLQGINPHLKVQCQNCDWICHGSPCKVEFKLIWKIFWTQRPVRLLRLRAACFSFMQCNFKNQLAQ